MRQAGLAVKAFDFRGNLWNAFWNCCLFLFVVKGGKIKVMDLRQVGYKVLKERIFQT